MNNLFKDISVGTAVTIALGIVLAGYISSMLNKPKVA